MSAVKNYPGSKGANGSWQQIISQIPKCDTFIEAMCGSAIISEKIKNKPGCIVINDIDSRIIKKHIDAGMKEAYVIESLDYVDLIAAYDYSYNPAKTVFYFDPPYLMQTRSHKKNIYRYDWTDKDHCLFLSRVLIVKSNCMISHYPCPLYDETLKDWRKINYQSMTRAGVRTEALYMNYPLPVLLQDYKNVGENFTDRQRIKRKVTRLIDRLNREKDIERSAILTSIIEHFSYVGSDRQKGL